MEKNYTKKEKQNKIQKWGVVFALTNTVLACLLWLKN